MIDTTTQPPTSHPRLGAQTPETTAAYRAGFAAVRANLPLRAAEAVTVHLDRDAIDAWLGTGRATVGGHWAEVGR